MPPHRLPIQMAYNTRIPFPRIRHFERKREIFFVRGKAKAVRIAASGKHPAPCAPKKRCFMQTAPRRKKNTANEKDPSAPLGMTIRETAFLIFPFISRRFQPPPLRGTSFHEKEGRKMPPPRTPHEESSDTRIPPPRIRHFERMREIFFVRGKAKDVRIAASGKHRAPCESEERCFMQTDSRVKQKMTNEKDPSTTLGMTI